MTPRELINKLEDIASQNADNVIVLRGDNSGQCKHIENVSILDAIDTNTGKKTVAVVIQDDEPK